MPTTELGTHHSDNQAAGQVTHVLAKYGRIIGISAALSLSIIFALGAWYALYEAGSDKLVTARIPLIKADPRPVKVKPKDPGGLKFPNQDKLVFERITPKIGPTVEEKLSPEPEEPIATSDITKKEVEPENSDKNYISKLNTDLKPGLAPPTSVTTNHDKANLDYKIQMAAFRKEDQAKASWMKMKNSHVEILGSLIPLTERVNLGKKGVYFRVQAGYFNGANFAQNACTKLKAKGQNCIIVRSK